ncbi:hypothetical protein [Sphingomonas sp. Root241]|uniref:hypothetical protein n=1 Tax=Sphingomonas sp. Root241 TaxID=1736501 RepID=UPI0006FA46D2|nr:hypothetical protein [Sphingomonas sp. Root241]KRC81933.1 hypothetical protein ASE13_06155 [Sphingomonas sp. Root241]
MSNPADYVFVGVLNAIHAISPNKAINHSLTIESIQQAFAKEYAIDLQDSVASYIIKRMESAGILVVIVDPYADTVLEIADSDISAFAADNENAVIARGWSSEDWIKSALKNQNLWDDMERLVSGAESIEAIPSADGFVTVNHNSAAYIEAEASIVEADDALRGDNEFEDDEQRSWIRIHIETGIGLLKRGGPVLRAALIALIVEPLKAALKATTSEKVKTLVGVALAAFLKWLGL